LALDGHKLIYVVGLVITLGYQIFRPPYESLTQLELLKGIPPFDTPPLPVKRTTSRQALMRSGHATATTN
jgi:hypothetical protein